MSYSLEQLEEYQRCLKNIHIRKYKQAEYRSVLDSLFNAIFTKEVFSQETYIEEEHKVRADS